MQANTYGSDKEYIKKKKKTTTERSKSENTIE